MGSYLSQPINQKAIEQQQGKKYSFISAEMQGWRKTMQDACIHKLDLGDGNSLFGVFDGHGGHQVSKYVSKIFQRQLKNADAYKKNDYKKALNDTFKKVDELIQAPQGQQQLFKIKYSQKKLTNQTQGNRQFIGSGVGCTANVVLVTPTSYIVANAGDSRSVLCRQGKAIDLSKDHKPDSPQEQQRIKKAGGYITMGRVNGGLNLTRSFGDFDYKKNKELPYNQQMITCNPDIKQFQCQKGDEFILIGCDGIWQKYVENSQGIIDIIRQDLRSEKEKRKIVEDLLDGLLAKDTSNGIGCDNMTLILVKVKK